MPRKRYYDEENVVYSDSGESVQSIDEKVQKFNHSYMRLDIEVICFAQQLVCYYLQLCLYQKIWHSIVQCKTLSQQTLIVFYTFIQRI